MDDWLRALAAKASSIHERLTPDFVPIGDGKSEEIVDERMRAWLAAAANGDTETFRRRLAWDGLDEELARRAVRPVRLRPGAALPDWALTVREVLRLASSRGERERCLDERRPIPFEDVLTPFVTWARSACQRKAGSAYTCFEEVAHAALERQLLDWLSERAARALWLELSLDLSADGSELDLLLQPEPSRRLYEAFVARMLSGGLVSFFEEYSVLARWLATTAELWVEATAEMLDRFHGDADTIRTMLGARGALQVARVAPALSDPHRGLRSVAILTLGSGERVLYKPRALSLEVVWNELLGWLGELGAPVTFRTFRVRDCGGYGWTECVTYQTCKDGEQARRYFARAGALLCIVYLLNGGDCHADNMIPAGEHPMLIDLETMLCPQTRDPAIGAEATRLARRRLSSSVLSTYLLPVWSRSISDGEVFDGSALGADEEQERASTRRRWVFVNTDRVRLARVPQEKTPPRAAMADGRPLRVYEYEAELVSGFEAMYRFLIRERNALLRPESPFQRLRGTQVRFVYRDTSMYAAVLEGLRKPDLLRDGADRSIEIEQLAAAALSGAKVDDRPSWEEIWSAERKAIERGDVPYFSALAADDSVFVAPDLRVSDWFEQSGHDAAIERLNLFDESDLAFQVDLIRSALRSRAAEPGGVVARREAPYPSSGTHRPLPSNAEPWLTEALAIARSLAGEAIRGSDGSLSWLQPVWPRELMLADPKRGFEVVGNDLYDGAVGIGLFLSAVEHVAPGAGRLPLAMGAVYPSMLEIEERGEQTAEHLGIGGLTGLGSVVYGLVCMAKLLGKSELLRSAECAASLITPKRIDADVALDVTFGSAGALLGLLALYETNAMASTLESARRCGERLLARLEPAGRGLRSLRTLDGRFLTGFSHGAAGIAYALCRLHAVTRDPSLLDAAREVVAFERSTFSVESGDWPDLRHSGPLRFRAAWCHGAPGIALGRIASLGSMDDEETRREIDRALEITEQQGVEGADHLCCGTFGVVEILSTAGRLLGRPELGERAKLLAWHMVSRSKDRGEYVLGLPSVGHLRSRGLFQGLAGIGYTLLRLARPDVLPQLVLLR